MERMMRASEVAEILSVSKAYVYILISRGELPSLRLGRVRRVRYSDLDLFITQNISERNQKSVALMKEQDN